MLTAVRRAALTASSSFQLPLARRALHSAATLLQDAAAAQAPPAAPAAPEPTTASSSTPTEASTTPAAADRPVPPIPEWSSQNNKRRGFIKDDPLPDRPPEDDIAASQAYFEILIAYSAKQPDGPEKSLKNVCDRVKRLMDPANMTMVLNTYAVREVKCPPEVGAIIEGKLLAEPELIDILPVHYLCAMGYGFGINKLGSKPLFELMAKRVAAIGTLTQSDAANLKRGLDFGGVALPAEVKVVPDPKLDLPDKWE
jgi:hypothetical protein